jgi:hypothetical protein
MALYRAICVLRRYRAFELGFRVLGFGLGVSNITLAFGVKDLGHCIC